MTVVDWFVNALKKFHAEEYGAFTDSAGVGPESEQEQNPYIAPTTSTRISNVIRHFWGLIICHRSIQEFPTSLCYPPVYAPVFESALNCSALLEAFHLPYQNGDPHLTATN
tara:strand:- start:683 stop:1015 length:333 start_codon:yes stop_codon:yes gene_type:complete